VTATISRDEFSVWSRYIYEVCGIFLDESKGYLLETRLGGLITSLTPRFTKKKEPMAVFRLEDLDGSIEVVVFPDAYRDYQAVMSPDRFSRV